MQSIGLLLKVLWSPAEAMLFLSKNPRVLTPLVFGFLCALLGTILVGTRVNYNELNIRMMERTRFFANMPEEQKEQIRKSSNSPTRNMLAPGLAAVSSIISVVVCTAIYFGVFTIFGREGTFKAFLSITAYAFVPMIFRMGAMVLSAFVAPSASLMLDELGSLSPGVFLDRDTMSPVLFAAA